MGVRIAKAIAFRTGGEGAAASVGKGESADGEGRGDGALVRHCGSIANVKSIEK